MLEMQKQRKMQNAIILFFFLFHCIITHFADLGKETWFLGQIRDWAARHPARKKVSTLVGKLFFCLRVCLLPLSDILVVCVFLFSDRGERLHGS